MSTAAVIQAQPIIPDLATYVAGAFEGTNEAVNVGAAHDADEAERLILRAIERVAPRRLTPHERARVGMEVVLYWNRRAEQRKALLRQTQDALANPFRMFAS